MLPTMNRTFAVNACFLFKEKLMDFFFFFFFFLRASLKNCFVQGGCKSGKSKRCRIVRKITGNIWGKKIKYALFIKHHHLISLKYLIYCKIGIIGDNLGKINLVFLYSRIFSQMMNYLKHCGFICRILKCFIDLL